MDTASGSYRITDTGEVVNTKGAITNKVDGSEQPPERLDWEVFGLSAEVLSDLKILLISALHPDEEKVAELLEELLRGKQFLAELPVLAVLYPYLLASLMNRRTYIAPLSPTEFAHLTVEDAKDLIISVEGKGIDYDEENDPSEIAILKEKYPDHGEMFELQNKLQEVSSLLHSGYKIQAQIRFDRLKPKLQKLLEGTKDNRNFHLGKKLNLNRQFTVPRTAHDYYFNCSKTIRNLNGSFLFTKIQSLDIMTHTHQKEKTCIETNRNQYGRVSIFMIASSMQRMIHYIH
jgi:hypothetical protein